MTINILFFDNKSYIILSDETSIYKKIYRTIGTTIKTQSELHIKVWHNIQLLNIIINQLFKTVTKRSIVSVVSVCSII